MNSFRKFVAEFVGTFLLVFVGTGAIIYDDFAGGSLTPIGIAIAFGFVVGVVVQSFGSISGAHINPAVTFGFWAHRKLDSGMAACYVVAQIGGALFASSALGFIAPTHPTLGATISKVSHDATLGIEVTITFILMSVILIVSKWKKAAPLAIGATVAAGAYIAGPYTGASMNPARSLGPAVISNSMDGLWMYLVWPMAGSLIAVLAWRQMERYATKKSTPESIKS